MSDRLKKLFELTANQYDESVKIIIEAGQLLFDTVTNKVFALLKLKNVRKESVKGVKIALTGYNVEGIAVEEKEYSYLDMLAKRNQNFGAKTPVYFENELIRSFKISIIDVVTESGKVVFGVDELKRLPETTLLKEYFQNDEYAAKGYLIADEYVDEYNRLVGTQGAYVPMKCGYLWLCSCGKYNSLEDETCYACGTSFEKQLQYLDKELIASSYAQRVENERKQADYDYACGLLTYNTVSKVKEAIELFENLGDYADSAEKVKACYELLPELEKKETAEKVAKDKKRKKRKKGFLLSMCAILIAAIVIFVIEINNPYKFVYDNENDAYILSEAKWFVRGCYTEAEIPEEHNGKPVYAIGSYAFSDCRGLTSITIPDSVTFIGDYAFRWCRKLTSVTIGNSVTSIGEEAFYCCSKLTSITIPDSVTSIGDAAFCWCSRLTSITIPDSVTSIDSYAFEGCSNLQYNEYDNAYYLGNDNNPYVVLVKAKDTSITSCTINDKTKVIYKSAFEDCSKLTSVIIPDSVTSIGDYAFRGCSKLTSITIPDSVTSIGDDAFCWCSRLTSITIPDSVTSIGDGAFWGCSGLTSVTIGNSVTSIGGWAFYGCSKLTSVIIGNNVTTIGDYAFYDCSNLQYNEYDNAYYLGNNNNPYVVLVEAKDTSITSCTINDKTKVIYQSAFSCCSELTSVIIPDSVTSIGSYAFYKCSGLTSVIIPDSVTSIGSYAFYKCSGLTSITFENTSAWYRTNSSSSFENKIGGTYTSVTNSSTNAKYFMSTYFYYYWYKL